VKRLLKVVTVNLPLYKQLRGAEMGQAVPKNAGKIGREKV
jgi:hypothetical protein